MASVQNQDPNDPNNGTQTSTGAPGTSTASGQGNVGTSGGVASQAFLTPTAAAPKANQSGQFTNLQQYLNANQGGGQNISGAINQNANNQANAANNTVNNTNSTIGNQIQQENQNIAQASGYANTINNGGAASLFGGYNTGNNQFNDQSGFQNFQQLASGANNGAQLSQQVNQSLQPVQGIVNNLNNFANEGNTEQGRFNLLQQTLGRAGYNQGQQSLDQALLQNGGNQTLSNLQGNLQGIANNTQNNFIGVQQGLQNKVNAIAPAAQAAQQQIANAIGTAGASTGTAGQYAAGTGAVGQLQGQLVGAANAQNAQSQADVQSLQNALNSGSGLSTQQFNDLNQALGGGISATSALYNTPQQLAQAFSAQNYGINNEVTAPQMAQYQALQALSGNNANANITGLTGAVAAPTNDVNINTNMFAPQYQKNEQQYNQAIQPDLNLMEQVQGNAQQGGVALNGSYADLAGINATANNATYQNQLTSLYNDIQNINKNQGVTGNVGSLLNPQALAAEQTATTNPINTPAGAVNTSSNLVTQLAAANQAQGASPYINTTGGGTYQQALNYLNNNVQGQQGMIPASYFDNTMNVNGYYKGGVVSKNKSDVSHIKKFLHNMNTHMKLHKERGN